MPTPVPDAKRVAFCTFGCRLNQYDTETLRTLLAASERYRTVPMSDEADVYVVNTCSVTARADASARKAIRRIHAQHPGARIVVTGCYAQRAPEELAQLDGVSLIVGAADRGQIVPAVDRIVQRKPNRAELAVSDIAAAKTFLDVPITEMRERSRAYVKVQEGCNESCTFCIIPQTRGVSRSREPARVVEQVHALVAAGYVEIVVTGVHVGDYGLDLAEGRRLLSDLIQTILTVPGLERFRLSSIEPASVTPELVELMASEPKFARHFHIPFQSGSDEILRRMRRRYTADEFRKLVERIAERMPHCGIGTDVICGFPGETDAQFRQTFECLEELPITYIHPFTYSVRPGSEAESFEEQVPGDEKKRRTRALKRLSQVKAHRARAVSLGEIVEVLVELPAQVEDATTVSVVHGWTDNYLKVQLEVPSAELDDVCGRLRPVKILGVADNALHGELVR